MTAPWRRELPALQTVRIQEEAVMRGVARLLMCVVILVTGCGTSPEPNRKEVVADPTAVSPGELLEFDLESGEIVTRVTAPADGDQHELNDLVVDADGAVLVGDAPVGAIYRLTPGADGFETVVAPGTLFSPQGIVILPDGGQTLIADYSRGLCLLGFDGSVHVLKSPPDAWLGGIDGLSVVGRRELIAVQNGVTPNRVVRIRLTEDVGGVEAVVVLDLAHPEHDQPTLGEIVGVDFLYVANSLWGAWDRDGNLVKGRTLSPPVILRVPLG